MTSNQLSPSRIAICSDIHANLPALQTFLDHAAQQRCERIVCCGDVVGYGAHPNECCEILRDRDIPTIMGNHDEAAIHLKLIEYFNDIARAAILWTHDTLTEENQEFLKGLPYVRREGDLTFVHSSPLKPEEWNYVLTLGEARLNFMHFDTWLCFIGHSHQPFAVELADEQVSSVEEPEIELDRRKRYIINVGSIGQPRDRSPLLSYVVLDLEQETLQFHRVRYAVKDSQQAILKAGLPAELAERLAHGW